MIIRLFFLIFVFCISPVIAQVTDPLGALAPSEEGTPRDLSLIPKEFIVEALNFSEECNDSRVMSMYFDCQCMASAFLDARIEAGPDADRSVIVQRVGQGCADGSGIAGSMYESCKGDVLVPVELDIEEYCTCYANTYARLYEGMNTNLNSKRHVRLMTQSKLTCRNPGLAARLYGRSAF